MTRRARILLADDHTLITEALVRLLEPRYEVVGKVADGQALLTTAREAKPDVVIVDISMPVLNGLEAARYLREEMPSCKLIFLTMTHDADLAREAIRIGASGYLLKTSAGWELLEAVDSALRGRQYVTPALRRALDRQPPTSASRASSSELTARQREVLRLLAQGHSMKQAAAALGLTPRTVAFHKYQMMGKFRLGSNAELVQFAIRHGVIT
ncbi:MAG TPA: response regulator transcription factor [Methylomirabilota bacterium]|jgi:DNA-binding NarL/FixJ family response regulator